MTEDFDPRRLCGRRQTRLGFGDRRGFDVRDHRVHSTGEGLFHQAEPDARCPTRDNGYAAG